VRLVRETRAIGGFGPELRAAGERGEVVLVDLRRLYGGS
jgi:hypothetical protein